MKLSIYFSYWKDNNPYTIMVMPPTSVEDLDLVSRWGSEWKSELMAILAIDCPGELHIIFDRYEEISPSPSIAGSGIVGIDRKHNSPFNNSYIHESPWNCQDTHSDRK